MKLQEYISNLTIPQGAGAGDPFSVLPWERRFLRGFERTSGDTALSVARGNGKTCLVASIACAVADPDGPLHGPRHEVVVVASSFGQGRISFEDCLSMLRERTGLRPDQWRIQDSENAAKIEHRKSGARIRCIGSDPARAHGLRPRLVIADEPAQGDAAKSDSMLAALRTGLGKVSGSRLIAIGTRPASAAHWFRKMLEPGGCDFSLTYAAGKDDPPLTWRTVKKANPSLGFMTGLADRIRSEMDDARRDTALLASFEALRLNRGTSDTVEAVLLEAGTWEGIESDAPGRFRDNYILGVDMAATAAMSAASAYHLETGKLDCFGLFPHSPDLAKRELRDHVPAGLYRDMERRCELLLAGEFVSDPQFLLAEAHRRWGRPVAVVADRWREGELRQALSAARFPLVDLILRGQGFKDGSEDVRAFRTACLGGNVRPVPSLLLRSAIGEARTVSDVAGNAKLSKGSEGGRRTRARDDAAAAAILAVAEGSRRGGGASVDVKARRSWRYAGAA